MLLLELINVAKTFQNIGDKLTSRLENDESTEIQDAKKFISYIADKVDPTRNQKYTLWILRTYIKGGIKKYEDFGRVLEYLTIFDKHKKKMRIKDINQIKTLSDLGEISLPFADEEEEPSRKQQKKSQEQNFYDSGEAELIFNSDRLKIVIPKTIDASCYFGKNTQWCTAPKEKNPSQFNYYTEKGPLYILLDKKANKRFQFHASKSGTELMDENDRRVDLKDLLNNYPEVLTINSLFKMEFVGDNFKLYILPQSNIFVLHSLDDTYTFNLSTDGLRPSGNIRFSNWGRSGLVMHDFFELYPSLLNYKKLFKFDKTIGKYQQFTLPNGVILYHDNDETIQTYTTKNGFEININGNRVKKHDFFDRLPQIFNDSYDHIAAFTSYNVYRNKNNKSAFIVRDSIETIDMMFVKGALQLSEAGLGGNEKLSRGTHSFFKQFNDLFTINEMFIPQKPREGFEIYAMPLSDMFMLHNENKTMIVKEEIANTIKSVEFKMPPRTVRKGFGFVAPFEQGLKLLPGASQNAIKQHTKNWNEKWDIKGKGREKFKQWMQPIPSHELKNENERKDKFWLQGPEPDPKEEDRRKQYPINWYEIYGLLGEVTDWGEQKLRWSYYAHGRDEVGNEYWYAYDQGGHIQSGTGTYRFKPVE